MATPIRDRAANRRVRVLGLLLGLGLAAVFARAFWLQVVEGASLAARARAEHQGAPQQIAADRGTIFDDTGVPLAIDVETETVYADPQEVTDAAGVAMAAHEVFGVDADALENELADKQSQFVYVQRFAAPAAAARFLKLGFAGVNDYPEQKRVYPENTVAPQVIGYAGVDGNGLGGLELVYNKALAGSPGSETIVHDPSGQPIEVTASTAPVEGSDVVTTLNDVIQAQAEQVLAETVKSTGATSASAIVMDPSTGGILAMAQTPSYNDNDTPEVPTVELTNRAVTDTYEPGSTFKVVTITAALTEGIVTPETKFTIPPELRYGPCEQCVVHDAENHGTEVLTVAQILAQSSNIGATEIAEKLGASKLESWIYHFGFGAPTGIDFPGESPGFVLPLDQWSETTIGNVPYGQGVSVTPIQMASVYAGIANGGEWIQPHLVSRIGNGAALTWHKRRLMSPKVDAELMQMLQGVVADPGATANEAQIPGYSVAGKTGTAQVSNGHGYSLTDYDASFVGIVPAKHPRLVILVKVNDPKTSIYGGVVAAPAFQQIAKFDLQYLEVPPDEPTDAARTLAADS